MRRFALSESSEFQEAPDEIMGYHMYNRTTFPLVIHQILVLQHMEILCPIHKLYSKTYSMHFMTKINILYQMNLCLGLYTLIHNLI